MHSKKVLNKTLYHLFVVLFGFVMVYPVLWMVSGSFKGNAEILRGTLALIPNELKLDNYATGWKGFGGTTFGTFFKNSIFITIVATFGTVLSSSLVAYALSRIRFRGSKFWFTCMLITMMLPGQVIMIPQYLIYYRLGSGARLCTADPAVLLRSGVLYLPDDAVYAGHPPRSGRGCHH